MPSTASQNPRWSWAIQMDRADAALLSPLRLISGISVCDPTPDTIASQASQLWLRGEFLDDSLDLILRKLPARRFGILENGKLLSPNRRIPRGNLPNGPWIPIVQWLMPAAQSAALPGNLPPPISLRWEPSDVTLEPKILITSGPTFRRWAIDASIIRLMPLNMAISRDGLVLVRGTPLPPLPGKRFVEQNSIAWLCGLAWIPRVQPAVLADLLHLEDGDLGIFHEDGSIIRVDSAEFVPVTRASARISIPDPTSPQSNSYAAAHASPPGGAQCIRETAP